MPPKRELQVRFLLARPTKTVDTQQETRYNIFLTGAQNAK